MDISQTEVCICLYSMKFYDKPAENVFLIQFLLGQNLQILITRRFSL